VKIKSLVAKALLARAAARTRSGPVTVPLELAAKSLLVLLPAEQRELTVVKQVLPELTGIFGDQNVYLMGYPNTNVESIFPSKGFRIISPGKSAMTWCGLPSSGFLERLKSTRFDYIFDTNLADNPFAARVLLNFPEAIRFGEAGHLGLPYLNLEIKTKYLRDRRLIYRSILEVIANLARIPIPLTP